MPDASSKNRSLEDLPEKKAELEETRQLLNRLQDRKSETDPDRYDRLAGRYRETIDRLEPEVEQLTEEGETRKLELEDRLACQQSRDTLLAAGADPGGQADSRTPLHGAARAGHTEVVRTLLEASIEALLDAGADPNAGRARTHTALMEAARKGHATVVRRLLEAGADPDAQMEDSRNEGKTALRFALEAGHTETARLLREADAQR